MQARRIRGWVLGGLLGCGVGVAPALDLRWEGDLLSVQADNVPVREVLARLAAAGVAVKIDPAVLGTVTAHFARTPVDRALGELLRPYGYAIFWDLLDGPLGKWPRLTEVQVYQPGRQRTVQPLGAGTRLSVVTPAKGQGPAYVRDEVLLALKPGVQRDAFLRLLARLGATVLGSLPQLGLYQLRLPPGSDVPAAVAQLAREADVARAEPNYALRTAGPVPAEASLASAAAGAARTPAAPSAQAPALAVLDSGLAPLPALQGLVVGQYDSLEPGRTVSDPVGHGTQMALVAAGVVAPLGAGAPADTPGVPVLAVRAFDDQGQASNFSLMRALTYAADNGARVVNLSWGEAAPSAFLAEAVRYVQGRDVVVVAAAGNEPTGQPIYPAALPGVLAVGALTPQGQVWRQSNTGDFLFAAAPGVAALPVGYEGPPGTYAGTSIASAYVARSLATYFAQHPQATAAQATAALQAALSDRGTPGHDAQYGFGVLDAAALVRLAQ